MDKDFIYNDIELSLSMRGYIIVDYDEDGALIVRKRGESDKFRIAVENYVD